MESTHNKVTKLATLWTFVAALGGNTSAFSLVGSYHSVSPDNDFFGGITIKVPFFYGLKALNCSTSISTTAANREEIRCSMHAGMKIPHLLRAKSLWFSDSTMLYARIALPSFLTPWMIALGFTLNSWDITSVSITASNTKSHHLVYTNKF